MREFGDVRNDLPLVRTAHKMRGIEETGIRDHLLWHRIVAPLSDGLSTPLQLGVGRATLFLVFHTDVIAGAFPLDDDVQFRGNPVLGPLRHFSSR